MLEERKSFFHWTSINFTVKFLYLIHCLANNFGVVNDIQKHLYADGGVIAQLEFGPGNIVITPTKGVNSGSNAVKGIICGNFFSTAVDSTHDQTINNMESDGWICVGNEYADEVSVDAD